MKQDTPIWKQALAALLVLAALASLQAVLYRAHVQAEREQAALEAALRAASVPWAPVMEEVRHMASWKVEGAGDDSYNGVYEEAGERNGKPYYQKGEGAAARYLFWESEGEPPWWAWMLSNIVGGLGYYISQLDADLPGNPWSVVGGGVEPAPTVSSPEEPPAPPPQPDPNPGEEVPSGGAREINRGANWFGEVWPIRPCRFVAVETDYDTIVMVAGGMRQTAWGGWEPRTQGFLAVCPFDRCKYYFGVTGLDAGVLSYLLPGGDGESIWYSGARYALDFAAKTATFAENSAPLSPVGARACVKAERYLWVLNDDLELRKWDLTTTSDELIADLSGSAGNLQGTEWMGPLIAGQDDETFYAFRFSYGGLIPHKVTLTEIEPMSERIAGAGFVHDAAAHPDSGLVHVYMPLDYTHRFRALRWKPGHGDGWFAPASDIVPPDPTLAAACYILAGTRMTVVGIEQLPHTTWGA